MSRPAAMLCSACALAAGVSAQAPGHDQPHDDAVPCPLALTPAQAEIVRNNTLAGLYTPPPAAARGTTPIPVVAHIVRRSDGTGGLTLPVLQTTIDEASTRFIAAGFELCLADTLFIDDDAFFGEIDTSAEIDALRSTNPQPGVINLYFTPTLASEAGTLCGISSFTFSDVQGIVIRNGCTAATGNASTLAHEIGHYFDLFHTHEIALGVECVSGMNCASAGDLVCDTAADPNILGEVSAACAWFGSASDPCGSAAPYAPPVLNLMSYSTKDCRQEFTADQFDRLAATLTNLRTDLNPVACLSCDNPADVNGDLLLTPADFNAWVLAFNSADPAADQNGDGVIDPADFNAWVINYNAGCP